MCTVVILRRPDHAWPLILAANRDEMGDRPWSPPGRHWPELPNIVAGIDHLAGGTWMGVNDEGVVAGVLNRRHSLGPAADARSRGELVLEALNHADAVDSVAGLRDLNARAYRAFNMVVADNRDAYWIKGMGADGPAEVTIAEIPEGVSMLTAVDLDDTSSARVRHFLPRFRDAAPPDPESGDWSGWTALLADRGHEDGAGPADAMTIVTEKGFGTLSSSLVAVPAPAAEARRPVYLFCDGRPGERDYLPVEA